MAKPAPVRQIKDIKFVTIHHSAVQPGSSSIKILKSRAATYDRFHSQRPWAIYTNGVYGFKYISYHYLVARDGSVLKVQDIKYMRWHANDYYKGKESHNQWGIAICLDGNFQNEKPTQKALNAVAKIIYDLEVRYKKSYIVRGHRHTYSKTACPGVNMGNYRIGNIRNIIKMVNEMHKPVPPVVDNLYRVSKGGKQLGAYKKRNSAFDKWYTEKADKVVLNGKNITSEFNREMNILEKKITDLEKEVKGCYKVISIMAEEKSKYKQKILDLDELLDQRQTELTNINGANMKNIQHIKDLKDIFKFEGDVVEFRKYLRDYKKGCEVEDKKDGMIKVFIKWLLDKVFPVPENQDY